MWTPNIITLTTAFLFLAILFAPSLSHAALSNEPAVFFVAYPNVVQQGKAVTLEWNSSNASSCSASFAEEGENLPIRGTRMFTPSSGRYGYTLSCVSPDGVRSQAERRTVIVQDQKQDTATSTPATITRFHADKKVIVKGDSVKVEWDAPGSFACAGTGDLPGWVGLKHSNGSFVANPSTTVSLNLVCWNSIGELTSFAKEQITVRGMNELFIPDEEFSDIANRSPQEKQNPQSTPIQLEPLCDKNLKAFKQTKTIQCGHVYWKLGATTITRLGANPLPYFQKYNAYYEFLRDFLQYEPSGLRIKIIEDKTANPLRVNTLASEIRISPSFARAMLAKGATHRSTPLILPLVREMATIFFSNASQRPVFIWHSSLEKSFADIVGIGAYLAQSDRSSQVLWFDRWCEKKRQGPACNAVLSTTDQFASVSQDTALARQKAIRTPFNTLFPVQGNKSLKGSGGDLFAAITTLILRDFEDLGKLHDAYSGLQETLQFMTQWEAFPDTLKANVYSSDVMKRKLNVFVFLFSINIGNDVSWYYERFGLPITKETKDLIARFLKNGSSADSLAQAIESIAGVVTPVPTASVAAVPTGTGVGLRGMYYDKSNLDAFKLSRTDSTINFDWGFDSPISSIESNSFSVRWTGLVEPRYTGEYTFWTLSDDGVRLWVDNKKLIDDWSSHPPKESAGTLQLVAGRKYPIQIEYYEFLQSAVMRLMWSSKQQPKEIIPSSQLYPL